MSKKRKNPNKFNLPMLIVTLIAATLTGTGLYFLYLTFREDVARSAVPMELFLGGLFALFLLVVCLVVLLVSSMMLTYRADVISGRYGKGKVILYLLGAALVIGLLIAGAQFLYALTFHSATPMGQASTYVFLVDDSSSMETNDRNQQRYDAVEAILSGCSGDTRYALYTFSTRTKLKVPMQTVSQGFPQNYSPDFNSTYMKEALETVIADYEAGVWTAQGPTALVMITDGDPMDFDSLSDVRHLLDKCKQYNITLGIVGVIGADRSLMEQMANYTGGQYADITDVSQLYEAVKSVSGISSASRDLLGDRRASDMGWLYALIRILAITLAGCVIAVAAALAYGNSTVFRFIVWSNIFKSLFAGVLMEAAFLVPELSTVLCVVSFVILGTILSKEGSTEVREYQEPSSLDFYDFTGNNPF